MGRRRRRPGLRDQKDSFDQSCVCHACSKREQVLFLSVLSGLAPLANSQPHPSFASEPAQCLAILGRDGLGDGLGGSQKTWERPIAREQKNFHLGFKVWVLMVEVTFFISFKDFVKT